MFFKLQKGQKKMLPECLYKDFQKDDLFYNDGNIYLKTKAYNKHTRSFILKIH